MLVGLQHHHKKNKLALLQSTSLIAALTLYFFLFPNIADAGGLLDAAGKWLAQILYGICLAIGGLFVALGGLALDKTFEYLVVGMGDLFHSGYGSGIILAWETIRDVFNIIFIYSFIYLGIKTILNSEDSNTRKSIGHLIVAALFINFSLFITLTIVDFTNVLAVQIYNNLVTTEARGGAISEEYITTDENSIAAAFLRVSSLTTFFGAETGLDKLDAGKIVVYAILMLIFFMMAGIIFLFAAFHLFYRFIALSIFMVLSPVLFLGLILPNFKGYTDKWLKGLLKQSFFAPAFLFLVYVSLSSLEQLKATILETNERAEGYSVITEGAGMTVDGFMIFVFFGIVIGFLYASVKVGEMMSIAGAGGVIKAFDSTAKAARQGLQGLAYRNTAGRLSNLGVKGMDALDRAAESKKGLKGWALRRTRDVIGGESTRKGLEKASNFGAGGVGLADAEKLRKTRTQRVASTNAELRFEEAIKAGTVSSPGVTERIAFEQAVSGASTSQLIKKLQDHKPGSPEYDAIVRSMTAAQVTKVLDSKDDEFNENDKAALRDGRGIQIQNRLTSVPLGAPAGTVAPSLARAIERDASTDDLVALGLTTLRSHAQYITAAKMDDLKGKLQPTEYALLAGERRTALEGTFSASPASAFQQSDGSLKRDNEIARLPASILIHPNALPHLNGRVLEIILRENYLDQAQRTAIYSNATTPGAVTPASVAGYLGSPAGANFI